MLARITPSRATVRGLAIGGAWFFIGVSLLHLLWAVIVKFGGTGGTFKLYHTVVDGVSYDAWALTYTGVLGLLLALVQTMGVTGAAVASTFRRRRLLRWRRAGHVVLVGWSLLWALNLVRLALIDHEWISFAQAALLCLLAGCTGYRAVIGWSPGRSRNAPIESAGGDEASGDASPDSFKPPAFSSYSSPPVDAPGEDVMRQVRVMKPTQWKVESTLEQAAPTAKRFATAARREAANGLARLAEFTAKQARRVSPSPGK